MRSVMDVSAAFSQVPSLTTPASGETGAVDAAGVAGQKTSPQTGFSSFLMAGLTGAKVTPDAGATQKTTPNGTPEAELIEAALAALRGKGQGASDPSAPDVAASDVAASDDASPDDGSGKTIFSLAAAGTIDDGGLVLAPGIAAGQPKDDKTPDGQAQAPKARTDGQAAGILSFVPPLPPVSPASLTPPADAGTPAPPARSTTAPTPPAVQEAAASILQQAAAGKGGGVDEAVARQAGAGLPVQRPSGRQSAQGVQGNTPEGEAPLRALVDALELDDLPGKNLIIRRSPDKTAAPLHKPLIAGQNLQAFQAAQNTPGSQPVASNAAAASSGLAAAFPGSMPTTTPSSPLPDVGAPSPAPALPAGVSGDAALAPPLAFAPGLSPAHAPAAASFGHVLQAATPPPVAEQVSIQIAKSARNGAREFTIRLDPPDMGRVDVRMNISASGHLQAYITADRQDTLDLMQRDARLLERGFQDAGLKADTGSLNFSLRDNQAGQGGQWGQSLYEDPAPPTWRGPAPHTAEIIEAPPLPAAPSRSDRALDITI
jgi:flagellar hook-length control protein FliK